MGIINRNGVAIDDAEHGIYISGGSALRGWNIGRIVPDAVQTTEEMIEATGLDWPVTGMDLGEAFPGIEDADRFRLNVRTDIPRALGVVGAGWKNPTNRNVFAFVDDLIADDAAKWLAAGELEGGRKIFGVVKLSQEIVIGGDPDESIIPLMLMRNGWDGMTSLRIDVAPFRLICTNGMTIPVHEHLRSFSLRHTQTIEGRMIQAREALNLSVGYLDEFTEEMNRLVETPFRPAEWDVFVDRLLPLPVADTTREDGGQKMVNQVKLRDLLTNVYQTSDSISDDLRATRYGALNAITEFADWHRTQRPSTDERTFLRAMDDETGLKSRGARILMTDAQRIR